MKWSGREDTYYCNSWCNKCEQEYKQQYRESNRDRLREETAQWSMDNPDYQLQYRIDNVDKRKEYNVKWHINNLEHARKKSKQWKQNNPDKVRQYKTDRRARLAKAEGTHTRKEMKIIYEHQQGICLDCGEWFSFKDITEDHIKPLSKGGSDWPQNIQLLCGPCNYRKGMKEIDYRDTKPVFLRRV